MKLKYLKPILSKWRTLAINSYKILWECSLFTYLFPILYLFISIYIHIVERSLAEFLIIYIKKKWRLTKKYLDFVCSIKFFKFTCGTCAIGSPFLQYPKIIHLNIKLLRNLSTKQILVTRSLWKTCSRALYLCVGNSETTRSSLLSVLITVKPLTVLATLLFIDGFFALMNPWKGEKGDSQSTVKHFLLPRLVREIKLSVL